MRVQHNGEAYIIAIWQMMQNKPTFLKLVAIGYSSAATPNRYFFNPTLVSIY